MMAASSGAEPRGGTEPGGTGELQSLGVVLTLYSRNECICRQVENMLRSKLQENLFETKIRVNTKATAAPSVKKTIFDDENAPKGRGDAGLHRPRTGGPRPARGVGGCRRRL